MDAATLVAAGSQFSIVDANGAALAVQTASVAGARVTLTTAEQSAAASYTVSVLPTLRDVFGSAYTPATATFTGFSVAAGSMIISEVFDPPSGIGSNGNPKFVELFNGSNAPVDLTPYALRRYSNGADNFTAIQLEDVTLAPGAVYVIASDVDAFTSVFGRAPDESNGGINGNGDDVYELFDGTNVVDVYGVVEEAPSAGTSWSYADASARRNDGINGGRSTFSAGEWTVTPQAPGSLTATPGTR